MRFSREICSLVISHLSHLNNRADIASLCRVSRLFRSVAELALYNSLSFLRHPARVVLALSKTLSAQPRLARLVDAITIQVSEDDNDEMDEDGYWDAVKNALQTTTKLRFLNVRAPRASPISLSWVLADSPFSLRSLHYELEWDAGLAKFLSTQVELRDLYLMNYDPSHPLPCDPHLLPNLTTFESPSIQATTSLIPHRPITHLKTQFTSRQHHDKSEALARFCASLQKTAGPILSLEIGDPTPTEAFTLDFLAYIVDSLDKAVNFRYLGQLVLPIDGQYRLRFYALLMCLGRLKHISLSISHWHGLPNTAAALCALAKELKLYCTEISTVVFVRGEHDTVIRFINGACIMDEESNRKSLWREV